MQNRTMRDSLDQHWISLAEALSGHKDFSRSVIIYIPVLNLFFANRDMFFSNDHRHTHFTELVPSFNIQFLKQPSLKICPFCRCISLSNQLQIPKKHPLKKNFQIWLFQCLIIICYLYNVFQFLPLLASDVIHKDLKSLHIRQ